MPASKKDIQENTPKKDIQEKKVTSTNLPTADKPRLNEASFSDAVGTSAKAAGNRSFLKPVLIVSFAILIVSLLLYFVIFKNKQDHLPKNDEVAGIDSITQTTSHDSLNTTSRNLLGRSAIANVNKKTAVNRGNKENAVIE